MANQVVKSEKSETKILETLFINDPLVHFWDIGLNYIQSGKKVSVRFALYKVKWVHLFRFISNAI